MQKRYEFRYATVWYGIMVGHYYHMGSGHLISVNIFENEEAGTQCHVLIVSKPKRKTSFINKSQLVKSKQ